MGKGRYFTIHFSTTISLPTSYFPKLFCFSLDLFAATLIGSLNGYADLFHSNYFSYLRMPHTQSSLLKCHTQVLEGLFTHLFVVFLVELKVILAWNNRMNTAEGGHCVRYTWLDLIWCSTVVWCYYLLAQTEAPTHREPM